MWATHHVELLPGRRFTANHDDRICLYQIGELHPAESLSDSTPEFHCQSTWTYQFAGYKQTVCLLHSILSQPSGSTTVVVLDTANLHRITISEEGDVSTIETAKVAVMARPAVYACLSGSHGIWWRPDTRVGGSFSWADHSECAAVRAIAGMSLEAEVSESPVLEQPFLLTFAAGRGRGFFDERLGRLLVPLSGARTFGEPVCGYVVVDFA